METTCSMQKTRETALPHVSCGKPARRRYYMYHAGNLRDGATTCSMRETCETALLHV